MALRVSSKKQEERERECSAEEPIEQNYSRPAVRYRKLPRFVEVESRLGQRGMAKMAEARRATPAFRFASQLV